MVDRSTLPFAHAAWLLRYNRHSVLRFSQPLSLVHPFPNQPYHSFSPTKYNGHVFQLMLYIHDLPYCCVYRWFPPRLPIYVHCLVKAASLASKA